MWARQVYDGERIEHSLRYRRAISRNGRAGDLVTISHGVYSAGTLEVL